MKIKNLTPNPQVIQAEELIGGRVFPISIAGHGTTDIEGMYVPNLNTKLFKVLDTHSAIHILPEAQEGEGTVEKVPAEHEGEGTGEAITPVEGEKEDTSIEEDDIEIDTPAPAVAEQFFCRECNKEFSSQRSLTMHINKVHPKE